jgi:hypothetical protein
VEIMLSATLKLRQTPEQKLAVDAVKRRMLALFE